MGAKHLTDDEYRRNEKAILKTIADCDALIGRIGMRSDVSSPPTKTERKSLQTPKSKRKSGR